MFKMPTLPVVTPLLWIKIGLAALILGLAIWALTAIHESIQQTGRDEIQALWDADKLQHQAYIKHLEDEYALREEGHRAENRRISSELSKANLDHANAIADVRAEYAQRLRSSEQRAAIYQRQAQGGAAERGDLASHASRLDAALEEGRSLVRELRQTLGLRDRQIEALSRQIQNDRKLIAEDSEK
jgi:hypothetical protein